MANFKIPKKDAGLVIVLNTPDTADAVLAKGVLTVKDEAGVDALKVKISDCLGAKKEAYAAGTAHKVDVDVTNVAVADNEMYSLMVVVPNLVNPESGVVHTVRTFIVSTDATATVTELQASFVAEINKTTAQTGLSATAEAGDVVRIAAASADMGKLLVSTTMTGATIADNVAYVDPVGTASEVNEYLLPGSTIVTAGKEYTRYTLKKRDMIRHNGVGGMKAVVETVVLIYAEKNAANYANFATAIDGIIAGTATAANYLGVPAL